MRPPGQSMTSRLWWTWLLCVWSTVFHTVAGRPASRDQEPVSELRRPPHRVISSISTGTDQSDDENQLSEIHRTLGRDWPINNEPISDVTDVVDYDGGVDGRLRCGVGLSKQLLSKRPQQYVIGPSTWNKTHLTFRILNFPANLSYEDVRFALSSAFQVWSDVTLLSFEEVQTGSSDISIEFAAGHHLDGYPFDGLGKVVAHAFFPGEEQGGDVHFDADEPWTVHSHEGVNLFMVAAHEIGHALGLSHSKEPGALMSPWHHGYYTDFVLPDDDTLAIQQLYGVRVPSRRSVFRAPTARPTTPAADHVDTGFIDSNTDENLDLVPDPCWTDLDAISVIRGELFAFKGKLFWRLSVDVKGRVTLTDSAPAQLGRFWYGFPVNLEHIDAVFEKQSDGHIFFFSDDRYWEFQGNTIDTEMSTTEGRPLVHLGLPPDVRRIDAAFVWGYNRRVYLVSGRHYWRFDDAGNSVVQYSYPRDMDAWAGVPLPVDAAFTHTDGRTYFFKGTEYWEFNDARMQVRHGFPRPIGERWLGCRNRSTVTIDPRLESRPYLSSSAALLSVLPLFINSMFLTLSLNYLFGKLQTLNIVLDVA